jgi:alkylhydroperoxidase family enzyme
MTADVAARMEQVLGGPPRLEPVRDDEVDARAADVVRRFREAMGNPLDAPLFPFFATLAHQPACFAGYLELGSAVMAAGLLPTRTRELITLRTGWLCGAPYQFGEHVVSAKRIGFTGADIERIKQGSAAEGWGEADRAILKAVEELHADQMICDATWAALAERLTPGELVELTLIVGHYHTTAFVQNALRFRLSDYSQGLAAT